ncbi:MAG: flagellin-like hook-associated protein FlgL/prefoldin subunit 5 [Natronomonas sp.]|jgi:flagellin-like hook-associated protein FlgL|uniref:hypothetical protein n=1 Tax=Natronomonas sp. TaxID=2184060 RepID=UPI003989FA35
MSNADQEELVAVTSDGVSVEKSFEPDDFPVPAIAFVIRSERDEAVSVRMSDTVPDDTEPEDIGFHPKYGAEFWDVEDGAIVFERDFEPGEEFTTVYGLRGGDAADAEKFMTEPELESIDPPLPEADSDDASGDVVRDVIEGDDSDTDGDLDLETDEDVSSAVNRVDTEEADEDESEESDQPSLDLEEPAEDSTDEAEAEDEADETGEESGDIDVDIDTEPETGADEETAADTDAAAASAVGADESLVSALADEIRSGDVDEDAVDDLRDALGVDLASASIEARIEHLQSEVADLGAYTEALEEFIDENGDAQKLLHDLREEVESVDERVGGIEQTADDALEAAESVDEAVEERLDEELDELWEAVDEAASDAADIAAELEELQEGIGEATEERIDELEAGIDDLSEELEDVAEMRDRLTDALGGLAGQSSDDE